MLTEGEVWARQQLKILLAARFSSAATGQFLVASQRRANAVRAARPALARQVWGWTALGTLVYRIAPAARGHRRATMAWWTACAVMLDWHMGMVETEDGRPRLLGPADALTLTRVWLAPLAWYGASPAIVLTAAATDVLDGRVARSTEPTRIGRDLEGLADTSFATAALRGALACGRIGRVAASAELVRLAVGLGYAFVVYFASAGPPDPALTRAARLTTPVRVAGLVAAAMGRRRLADVLVTGGAVASVAVVARAQLAGRACSGSPSGRRPSRPT